MSGHHDRALGRVCLVPEMNDGRYGWQSGLWRYCLTVDQ